MTIIKKPCGGCNKIFRRLHFYQGEFYCYRCYQKEKKPILLYESFDLKPEKNNRNVHFILTKEQNKKLNERLDWLMGKNRARLAKYVKTLILYDLNSWRQNDRNK
jgi:hypothetical protein